MLISRKQRSGPFGPTSFEGELDAVYNSSKIKKSQMQVYDDVKKMTKNDSMKTGVTNAKLPTRMLSKISGSSTFIPL